MTNVSNSKMVRYFRQHAAPFTRICLSPNANALAMVFWFSAIAVDLFSLCLLLAETKAGIFFALLALLLIPVLPCLIAAAATRISVKRSLFTWGLLTPGMLAGWSTALAVREYGWNFAAAWIFISVFLTTATPSVIGEILAQQGNERQTAT